MTITRKQRAIEFLYQSVELSKAEIKRTMSCGGVWLKRVNRKTTRLRKSTFLLIPGDQVSLYYDRDLLRHTVEAPICLFTTTTYSIWYKPPGLLTQGTRYGDHLSLLRYAEQQLNKYNRLHLIHRLDREAWGIIVLAHNKAGAACLSQQFRDQAVVKRYWTQVHGRISPEGKEFTIDLPLDGRSSVSLVKTGSYLESADVTNLFIQLKTGRYHQIRRHLASIGHPLVGDFRYGNRGVSNRKLQLCAYQLTIQEPVSRKFVTHDLPNSLKCFSD